MKHYWTIAMFVSFSGLITTALFHLIHMICLDTPFDTNSYWYMPLFCFIACNLAHLYIYLEKKIGSLNTTPSNTKVTITETEKIKMAFAFLKEDCSRVTLIRICSKSEIPGCCTKELHDNELFDHEYQNINTDYFDNASFWGDIYLPITDDIYLQFYVTA